MLTCTSRVPTSSVCCWTRFSPTATSCSRTARLGKSTMLHKLAVDLRNAGQRAVLVNAGAASSASDLLALVANELDLPEPPAESRPSHARRVARAQRTPAGASARERHPARRPAPSGQRLRAVRSSPRGASRGAPTPMVVAIRTDQSPSRRRAPADAFFSEVVEVPPLNELEIEQLLRNGLVNRDEARLVLETVSAH